MKGHYLQFSGGRRRGKKSRKESFRELELQQNPQLLSLEYSGERPDWVCQKPGGRNRIDFVGFFFFLVIINATFPRM